VRVTGFRNRGMFGRYDDAVALARTTGGDVDLAPVRRMQNRAGISMNAEQSLTANLGVFLRAGTTNGAIETYDFTDIDRTVAFGGAQWLVRGCISVYKPGPWFPSRPMVGEGPISLYMGRHKRDLTA
jgi:hypothetical protein